MICSNFIADSAVPKRYRGWVIGFDARPFYETRAATKLELSDFFCVRVVS